MLSSHLLACADMQKLARSNPRLHYLNCGSQFVNSTGDGINEVRAVLEMTPVFGEAELSPEPIPDCCLMQYLKAAGGHDGFGEGELRACLNSTTRC